MPARILFHWSPCGRSLRVEHEIAGESGPFGAGPRPKALPGAGRIRSKPHWLDNLFFHRIRASCNGQEKRARADRRATTAIKNSASKFIVRLYRALGRGAGALRLGRQGRAKKAAALVAACGPFSPQGPEASPIFARSPTRVRRASGDCPGGRASNLPGAQVFWRAARWKRPAHPFIGPPPEAGFEGRRSWHARLLGGAGKGASPPRALKPNAPRPPDLEDCQREAHRPMGEPGLLPHARELLATCCWRSQHPAPALARITENGAHSTPKPALRVL